MNEYGYIIDHALICQIRPNDHVKESMNEMQASKRMKEAMPHKAEAVRIEIVKAAEARAERVLFEWIRRFKGEGGDSTWDEASCG